MFFKAGIHLKFCTKFESSVKNSNIQVHFYLKLNLKVLEFYSEISIFVSSKLALIFSKRVIFAFEKRYFEKDWSN